MCYNIAYFMFWVFLAKKKMYDDVWDLSSPTRDGTHATCIVWRSLNHWTTREVPSEWPFTFFIIPDCQPILMVRDGGQLLFHWWEREQTYLSLQSTAKRFASVIEKTSKWSNFTKEETSTLATVLLESVKSTTLAAFLKPSANVSQTIQTKHLGRIYLQCQGHTWGLT